MLKSRLVQILQIITKISIKFIEFWLLIADYEKSHYLNESIQLDTNIDIPKVLCNLVKTLNSRVLTDNYIL